MMMENSIKVTALKKQVQVQVNVRQEVRATPPETEKPNEEPKQECDLVAIYKLAKI